MYMRFDISIEHSEMKSEIRTRKNHKKYYHIIEICAVVVRYARILGRKSSGCHRTESMTDGIEEIHATRPKHRGFNNAYEYVCDP